MISDILGKLSARLPANHIAALRWFEAHAGEVARWPSPLPDGTLLASKAKGIYKPAWSPYALSVRQSLESPYPDREIQELSDGLWRYRYFQENLDLDATTAEFTNVGLLNCYRDLVPVGVMLQVRPKPDSRYLIKGLAMVNGWEQGYFNLDGLPTHDASFEEADALAGLRGGLTEVADEIARPFEIADAMRDERGREVRTIRMRQGQAGFRRLLLDAYGRRCAVTAYDADESLEAAHILPYRGPVTHHAQNGLLLRSDIHSLFDLGLLAIHESDLTVILAPSLRESRYRKFEGQLICVPDKDELRPSPHALAQHRASHAL